MISNQKLSSRWIYLVTGVLYAWSILKVSFQSELGWDASVLAFNFTLTMCVFCLSAFVGGKLFKKFGLRLPVILTCVQRSGPYSDRCAV